MNNSFMLNLIAKLNKQLSKASISGDLKTLNNTMYIRVIAKISKTLSSRELKKQLRELNDFYINIGTKLKGSNETKQKLQQNIKILQQTISDLEIGLKTAKLESDIKFVKNKAKKEFNNTPVNFNLEIKKEKAIADIEYIGKKYSKLFSNMSASQKYENILNSAYSISNPNELKSVREQISAFTSELKNNGLAAQSTGDKWKKLIDRSKELFSAAVLVRTIYTQVKQSISTFLQLDSAMTNLYKVSDDITSREQFSGLLSRWNKAAQELKVSTDSLINSAAEWSKIGFNLAKSEELAKITAVFEKTAEISNEKANSTLVSAAQAFTEIGDLGEDDYIERVEAIGDRINAIGNKYSISSEGIADALQNSSAALKMANNDLDESIALVTAANKIFQNPDEVGNMTKILSARLRGQKGELEELGESTDGVIESVSKIQTQILNLTSNKVNIFEDDNETLKSTYDIILEIGEVYESLSDKDQASLLEIIGGKQRMSAVASLLLNYKELEKVKNDSMKANGSMEAEYAKYAESAEASIVSFKEKLVETYSTFMSGDLIKHVADIGSAILDLVNAADLLKHSLVAIAALKIGQGISTLGGVIASTTQQMNILGSALQKVKELPLDDVLRKDAIQQIGTETKNLTEKNLKLLLSQEKLGEQDRILILQKHKLTEEEAKAKLTQLGLTQATQSNTTANAANATSVNTLKGTFKNLTSSIKEVWAAMSALQKASVIFAVVSTAWSIISSAVSKHNQAQEEARQKAIETANASSEEVKNLQDLYVKYQQLNSIQNRTESQENEYKTALEEVTKALGDKADALKDLKEGTEEYNKVLDDATKKEFKEAWGDAKDAKNAAEANLRDVDLNGWSDQSPDNHYQTPAIYNFDDKNSKEVIMEIIQHNGLDKYAIENKNMDMVQYGLSEDASTEELMEFLTVLENTIEAMKQYEGEDLTKTKAYESLKSALDSVSDSMEEYTNQQYEVLKNEYLYKNGMPKTTEELDKMKASILANSGAGEEYQKVLANMLDSDFSGLLNGFKESADAIDDLNQKGSTFTESISKVQSLSKGLDQLNDIYADVKNKGDFDWSSILNNDDFKEAFEGLDEYDSFIKTISNNKDDIDACQDSFNRLATAYINSSDAMKGLSKETENATIEMLNQMGVENAKEFVTERLAAQEAFLAEAEKNAEITSKDLESATWDEIAAVVAEGTASKKTKSYLAKLALAKLDFNKNPIKTKADANELLSLAKVAGYTGKYINELNKAIENLDNARAKNVPGSSGGDSFIKYYEDELNKIAEKVKSEVDASINIDDFYTEIKENTQNKDKNSSSSKDTKQTYDWIETAIKRIETLISRLKVKADSVYKSWTSRNQNLRQEISAVRNEIRLQQQAYDRYMQQANSVGLSADWAEKVRNGQINIETVTDEDLSEKIKEYQEW